MHPCTVQALMLPVGAQTDGGGLVQDWLEGGKLGKALLRRYDDAAESCRELAVGTLSGLMQVRGGVKLSAPQQVSVYGGCTSCG